MLLTFVAYGNFSRFLVLVFPSVSYFSYILIMKLISSVMLMPQPTVIGVIVPTEDEVFTSYLHPYSLSTIMNVVVICWYLTFIRSKPTNFNWLIFFNPFKLLSSHFINRHSVILLPPTEKGLRRQRDSNPHASSSPT